MFDGYDNPSFLFFFAAFEHEKTKWSPRHHLHACTQSNVLWVLRGRRVEKKQSKPHWICQALNKQKIIMEVKSKFYFVCAFILMYVVFVVCSEYVVSLTFILNNKLKELGKNGAL